MACRNPLRHDGAARIAADMNHFCTGIRLLIVIYDRHRIELTDGILATKNATGILPGNRRACFNLGPRDFRVCTTAVATLGHEVVNAPNTVLVTGVPVLHGRVLDLGVFQGHQFNDCRV